MGYGRRDSFLEPVVICFGGYFWLTEGLAVSSLTLTVTFGLVTCFRLKSVCENWKESVDSALRRSGKAQPSGLKAHSFFPCMYGLKPVPFTRHLPCGSNSGWWRGWNRTTSLSIKSCREGNFCQVFCG